MHPYSLRRTLSMVFSLCILFTCCHTASLAEKTSFDTVNPKTYYGRHELTYLPNGNALVYAYDQLAKGAAQLEETINLVDYAGNRQINVQELSTVVQAYVCDYPQHFWFGKQYSYIRSTNNVIQSILPNYTFTASQLTTAQQKWNNATERLLAELTPEMSQFELEKTIHDRLAKKNHLPIISKCPRCIRRFGGWFRRM